MEGRSAVCRNPLITRKRDNTWAWTAQPGLAQSAPARHVRAAVGRLQPDGDLMAWGRSAPGTAPLPAACSTSCSRYAATTSPVTNRVGLPGVRFVVPHPSSPRSPTENTCRAAGCATPRSRSAATFPTWPRSGSRTTQATYLRRTPAPTASAVHHVEAQPQERCGQRGHQHQVNVLVQHSSVPSAAADRNLPATPAAG